MRNHKDLQVWSKAHNLTLKTYRATLRFPAEERFGLTSQIRRACVSIGANLAEGCGRRSDGELARFVQISMGSAAEFSYHFLVARDLGFLDSAAYDDLLSHADEVMRMLAALLNRVRGKASAHAVTARATGANS